MTSLGLLPRSTVDVWPRLLSRVDFPHDGVLGNLPGHHPLGASSLHPPLGDNQALAVCPLGVESPHPWDL